jgi:hypothetical protein
VIDRKSYHCGGSFDDRSHKLPQPIDRSTAGAFRAGSRVVDG